MVRDRGADGFVVQADVARPEEVSRMISRVQAEFGSLDIFVSNARPELPFFFQAPLDHPGAVGRGLQFTGQSVPGRSARSLQPHGRWWPDRRLDLRDRQPHRWLAAL